MSVLRVNSFQAKSGRGDELRDSLQLLLPTIRAAEGCRSCRLLRDQEEPTRFVMLELWTSVEAHLTSVRSAAGELVGDGVRLLDGVPVGNYYVERTGGE